MFFLVAIRGADSSSNSLTCAAHAFIFPAWARWSRSAICRRSSTAFSNRARHRRACRCRTTFLASFGNRRGNRLKKSCGNAFEVGNPPPASRALSWCAKVAKSGNVESLSGSIAVPAVVDASLVVDALLLGEERLIRRLERETARFAPHLIDLEVLDAFRGILDRKSTRLNCSHRCISYAVFCLKK